MSALHPAVPPASRRRAVIIESQKLFVPYLERAVADARADVVLIAKRPQARTLRRLRPDLIVLDASHLSVAPLPAIRAVRRAVPLARLVVYGARDGTWASIARALGADVVLGVEAGAPALAEAVAAG